jgi:hypothetical protein
MNTPVSHIDDSDMQAAPVALVRAADRARRLAEQTGTRFVVRASSALLDKRLCPTIGTESDNEGSDSLARRDSGQDEAP